VEIAVTDHVRRRWRRMIEEPCGGISQVGATTFGSPHPQPVEQARNGGDDAGDLAQLVANRLGVQRVEPRHRNRQRVRDSPH
jgi:hypothetical protein